MTVSSATNRVSYAGSGTTGPFTFAFEITAASDLVVTTTDSDGVETTLTNVTDYTISLDGDLPSAGSITTDSAVASGTTLVMLRTLALTQGTDFSDNDSLPAASIEQNGLDRVVMMIQQLQEELNRVVIQDVTASSQLELPTLENGKYVTNDGTSILWATPTAVSYTATIATGVDASKESSPIPGDIYVASDTNRLYMCFTTASWSTIYSSGTIPIGDQDTNGAWHIQDDGTDLIFLRREAGTWVQKGAITS